jgi:MazG family protein
VIHPQQNDFLERAMASRKKPASKTKKRKQRSPARRTAAELSPGEWFEKLVAVQARLRAPKGCPWDIEQTHETLRTYLIEEAYEVLEALDSGDDSKFTDEMGDLLLQVVFHSQIAREEGRFTVSDVIQAIHDKMIRRHPHVFGETHAKDSAEVLRNWEQIKAEERKAQGASPNGDSSKAAPQTPSLLDGVSHALPATMEGFQLTRKASRIGFDWDHVEGVFEKMLEEQGEVREAIESRDRKKIEEEIGDALFAAVNLSRFLEVDPEIALKKANAKFGRRFREMERLARESGREFKDVPRAEMETLWETAKQKGASAPLKSTARPGR